MKKIRFWFWFCIFLLFQALKFSSLFHFILCWLDVFDSGSNLKLFSTYPLICICRGNLSLFNFCYYFVFVTVVAHWCKILLFVSRYRYKHALVFSMNSLRSRIDVYLVKNIYFLVFFLIFNESTFFIQKSLHYTIARIRTIEHWICGISLINIY